MTRFIAIGLLATIGIIQGCASSDPDPMSREALRKGPPRPWGTTCTHTESSSYGSAHSYSKTQECFEQINCGSLDWNTGSGYGGGALYSGYSSYDDPQYFTGTCDNPQPVSCAQKPDGVDECTSCAYDACCEPMTLCQNDPNCLAVLDCLTKCNGNSDCVIKCDNNGERNASSLAYALGECTNYYCHPKCREVPWAS